MYKFSSSYITYGEGESEADCFWEHTKTNLVGSHGSWDDSAICICCNGEYRVRGEESKAFRVRVHTSGLDVEF